ncbi:hypothetical protein LC612_30025 [Nostoc sp. CHAB 5834]|nr:hypothetical protein [Nostoc sp. CHAB 5834]
MAIAQGTMPHWVVEWSALTIDLDSPPTGPTIRILFKNLSEGAKFRGELSGKDGNKASFVETDLNASGLIESANEKLNGQNLPLPPWKLTITPDNANEFSSSAFPPQGPAGNPNTGIAATTESDFPSLLQYASKLNQLRGKPNEIEEQASLIKKIIETYKSLSLENLSANPYLSDLKWKEITENINKSTAKTNVGELNGLGFFGSLTDPTIALDALATFMARRFKEELNIAYVSKMKDFLSDTTHYDPFHLLLPETRQLIVHLNPEQYALFLDLLREQFRRDLSNASENTVLFLKTDYVRADVRAPLLAGAEIWDQLHHNRKAYEVIEALPDLAAIKVFPDTSVRRQSRSYLTIAALFSRSIRDSNGGYPKPEKPDLGTVKLFLGLFTEVHKKTLQANTIKLSGKNPDLYVALIGQSGNLLRLSDPINSFLNKASQWQEAVKKLPLGGDASTPDEYSQYEKAVKSSFSLAISSLDLVEAVLPNTAPDLAPWRTQWIPLAENLLPIGRFIVEKRYEMAAFTAVDLVAKYIDAKRKPGEDQKDRVVEYITLLARLLTAQDRDQLVAILETTAQPLTSYRTKRTHSFNAAINGYGGGFIAAETLRSTDNSLDKQTKMAYGFTAPVGISVSTHVRQSSFSVFMPVLDIGGIFAFRLQDEGAKLPEVTWANFVSPGAYFIWGLPKSPLALSIGTQYGPEIRKITLKDNAGQVEEKTARAWRFGISLTVDIPLFNLATKR